MIDLVVEELLDLGIWSCHGCLIHEGLDGSRVTTWPSITY